MWYGVGDIRNEGIRVPIDGPTNQVAEFYAVLEVAKRTPPFAPLHVVSDSKYVVDGMTTHLQKWEEKGWIGVANAGIIRKTVAMLRRRNAVTTFRWIKGHAGEQGNEEADRLAKEGAEKPRPYAPLGLPAPEKYMTHGAALATMSQKLAYKGIRGWTEKKEKESTSRRITEACEKVREDGGGGIAPKDIWNALRKEEITKKSRDFLWKCLHGAHRVGKDWKHIPGYENRATCQLCGVEESMEHIITTCRAKCVKTAWAMCRALLEKKGSVMPELSMGIIMGAPAIRRRNLEDMESPGITRITRMCITETAYLVWVLRCERVVGTERNGREHGVEETRSRWLAVINKRLQMDQAMTRGWIAGNKRILALKVLETWSGLLEDESNLKKNWIGTPGVLVGKLQPG
ncbi:ribonuclease H-like protein [Trametes maxima]|nr:ribonuclease H-like protein [Trametes maxima]